MRVDTGVGDGLAVGWLDLDPGVGPVIGPGVVVGPDQGVGVGV